MSSKYEEFLRITTDCRLPWLRLPIAVPHEMMLQEAKAVRHLFVPHRDGGGEAHHGWRSLCLHGISPTHTQAHQSYGYTDVAAVPYRWTDIADLCPVTRSWLATLPLDRYFRIRFMLLEPGGHVAPHSDTPVNRLFPINVAINHPRGCTFRMPEYGVVPFEPGAAFMVNIHYAHTVANESEEDRYHLIIHGVGTNDRWYDLVGGAYAAHRAAVTRNLP